MENVHVALARRNYETIESWYYQGVITQVEWEAWLYAREVLHPDNDTNEPRTFFAPDAQELGRMVVAQWREDNAVVSD
jgi:hypothetical protein